MSAPRVVVAMSGGVDSSTAAALLREQGFEVVGVTLRLYDAAGTAASLGGRCCGPRDIEDARVTAAHLGIPHYVLDESAAFSRHVIDDFVAQHRGGRTPNPCVRCNQHLKFGPLLEFARAVGAEALATGHYARIQGPALRRSEDRARDQSYFLFSVAPGLLEGVRFPLGDLPKTEVRALARRHGLPNADKPDSHDICFIPDGHHEAFVERHGGAGPAGAVVDERGRLLGAHGGTHRFTIGQRKGVPAGGEGPRFVVRIDAATGKVTVGPRDRLMRRRFPVTEVIWRARDVGREVRCHVQVRHRAPARLAVVHVGEGGRAEVEWDEATLAPAPGQAAVFYRDDDEVLGGGFIDDDVSAAART